MIEVAALAAGVLTADELRGVAIEWVDDDDGPAVRVRGDEGLVDRIESALYPDTAPDGPAPVASLQSRASSSDGTVGGSRPS